MIKPCPKCKEQKVALLEGLDNEGLICMQIYCSKCKETGRMFTGYDYNKLLKKAVGSWNRRQR